MLTCLQDKPYIPFLLLLLVNNVILFFAWRNDKRYKKKELQRIEREANRDGRRCSREELKEEIKPQTGFTWTFCICICLDIWVLGAFFTHLWASQYFQEVKEEDSNKALFGDSFGAVNALISAFAFAGMLVAFFLQRYELRLQRKELELTRNEMNNQTVQFEKQNQTLLRQMFESTFFSMLQVQQSITEGLILQSRKKNPNYKENDFSTFPKYEEETTEGRDVFQKLYDNNTTFQLLSNGWRDYGGLLKSIEHNGYNWFHNNENLTFLDHYFRHLYHIIKYVDENDFFNIFEDEGNRNDEKYKYVSILRATLSDYELGCLFYNCLSENGRVKFKPLVERYAFFNNIRDKVLLIPEEDKKLYESSAFIRQ